ncbi:MAG: DUF4241 domain-containing protein [Leptolyngbyaceae cyanobacterium MO_188.B28]|nr:DUF4241 domain-containing protein [Leptolyngbyaceae cyanobacterium MO_188.B28]
MRTDFQKAFQEGFSFQYAMPYRERQTIQTVEFSVINIGTLKISSGYIIAQDLGWDIDLRYPFIHSVAPGDYPILLSLAGFREFQRNNTPARKSLLLRLKDSIDQRFNRDLISPTSMRRIACAKVQISDHEPIRWEVAVCDPNASENEQGYGVDSGTGCFMDLETARLLKQRMMLVILCLGCLMAMYFLRQ